ncbi:MAG: hypothetical protein ACJ790_20515, partial [Myxococcaceae bacterium]
SFTVTSSSAYGSSGQFAMLGSEAFVGDQQGPGPRAFDLSGSSGMDESGLFRTSGNVYPRAELLYGPYLLSAGRTAELRVFEVATPTSPHTIAAASGSGGRMELGAGLAYTSSGTVFDFVKNGTPRAMTSDPIDTCSYDEVRFDDALVTANGGALQTYDLKKQVNRTTSQTFAKSSDRDVLPMAAGVRLTGVDSVGGYLVAAEMRPTGVWLELFDATKLRDDSLATKLTSAESRLTYQVASMSGPTTHLSAHVQVFNGIALVMVEKTDSSSPSLPAANSLYVVDLRPALDADPATNLDPVDSVQGVVAMPGATDGVIRGNKAYVTSRSPGGVSTWNDGLYVIDISAAQDNRLTTKMASGLGSILSSFNLTGASSVAVYGDYAFLTPVLSGGLGIHILDLSGQNSGKLQPVAYLPSHPAGGGCTINGDGLRDERRTSTVIAGSRMYVSSFDRLEVIELE